VLDRGIFFRLFCSKPFCFMEENQNPYHDLAFRPLELLLLEERWNSGEMGKYVPLVQKFVEDRQDDIRKAAGPNPSHESIARGVIQLVLLSKSLDHAAEMLDQMEEISREIWIRGERGDYDRTKIALDWADEFGDSWRRWRLLKYTFVAVKCSMDIYQKLDA